MAIAAGFPPIFLGEAGQEKRMIILPPGRKTVQARIVFFCSPQKNLT